MERNNPKRKPSSSVESRLKRIKLILGPDPNHLLDIESIFNCKAMEDSRQLNRAPQLSHLFQSDTALTGTRLIPEAQEQWNPFSSQTQRQYLIIQKRRKVKGLWLEYKRILDELYCMEIEDKITKYNPKNNKLFAIDMMRALEAKGFNTIKATLLNINRLWTSKDRLRLELPMVDSSGKIRARFESFKSIEDEPITNIQYSRILEHEQKVQRRLFQFSRTGVVCRLRMDDLKSTNDSHLNDRRSLNLALSLNSQKLIKKSEDLKRMRVLVIKKMVKLVQKYWQLEKNEVERLSIIEEKRRKKLARVVSGEIKKRWRLVEEICRARYRIHQATIAREVGERNLDHILAQSSVMLGGGGGSVADDDDEDNDDDDDNSNNDNGDSKDGNQSHDSSNRDSNGNESQDCNVSVDNSVGLLEECTSRNSEQDEEDDINNEDETNNMEGVTNLTEWMSNYDHTVIHSKNNLNLALSSSHSREPSVMIEEKDEGMDMACKMPVPFLLKHTLREYQYEGMKWLATLYNSDRNGILAG